MERSQMLSLVNQWLRRRANQLPSMRGWRPMAFLVAISWWSLEMGSVRDAQGADRLPNLVIILADDLGYSDLGCYGGEIETPHLNRLAASGLRYSQFYNTARCWPTRAAMLTGYYAQQVNRDAWPGKKGGGQGQRPDWAPLLPSLLRAGGYRTYHSGKWHLDGRPLQTGFDRSYRLEDHDRYFAPVNHWLDDTKLAPVRPDENYYATTAIADHAIRQLKEHVAEHESQPFFTFVAFTSPHFPLQAPAERVEKYRARYLRGWDEVREERWRRLQAEGWRPSEASSSTALSPVEYSVGPPYIFSNVLPAVGAGEVDRPCPWDQLNDEQRALQATKMAIHAAMVEKMDDEVGRIVEQIRAMGAEENTLVLFLSDNGASAEMMVRGDGHDAGVTPGSSGSFLCLGPGWSTVCNSPFRRHKTWVHEGGVATPLIVSWPARIKKIGGWSTQVGHVVDLFPTLMELAGQQPPAEEEQVPKRPGESLTFSWKRASGGVESTEGAEDADRPRTVWWLHEDNRAFREGNWKIVASGSASRWELYDLSRDRCETRDLADQQPDRVRAMETAWQACLPAEFRSHGKRADDAE